MKGRIVDDPASITPKWMQETLSQVSAGAVAVRRVHVQDLGAGVGQLGRILRVNIEGSPSCPPSVVVKLPSADQRMARRTSDRLAEVVPARVRELLPEGWLDLANVTRLLVDPSASATLSERLSASGSSGAELAQEVAGYAGTALGGALSDTFLLGAAVASVSVVVAFFMHASGEDAVAAK